MKKVLHLLFAGIFSVSLFSLSAFSQNTSPYWSLAGNANAASTSKLGTTNLIPLNLVTNNSTRVRISTDGKVGIGTTNPQQRLHVDGSGTQGIFVSTSSLSTTSGAGVTAYAKGTPTASGQRLGYYLLGSRGGAENNYQQAGIVGYAGGAWSSTSRPSYPSFETTPSGSITRTERMRIAANGFVGIGVPNPKLPLEVGGRILLHSSGGGTAGLWLNNLANTNAIGFVGAANDGHIGLWGNTGANWGVVMNTTNGNVGVGTETPSSQLDVISPTAGTVIRAKSTFSGTTEGIALFASAVNASGSGYGVYSEGGRRGVLAVATGGNFTGSAEGVFGYASGSPGTGNRTGLWGEAYGGSHAYGIRGTASNGSTFNAAGYFSGGVYASSYNSTSDRKLKEKVKLLQNSLAQVMKLKPSTYQFKTSEYKSMHLPKGRQLGLIADEVKQVFPELVEQAVHPAEYDEKDRTKVITPEVAYESVNYQGLIPVLIASVQELSKKTDEIDELKRVVNTQQQQIEELKQLVSKLTGAHTISTSANSAVLLQNVPNPVKRTTAIKYSLPEGSGRAQLLLTDALGRTIKTVQLTTSGVLNVDVSTLSSGVYNYSLVVDGKTRQTRKMTVER